MKTLREQLGEQPKPVGVQSVGPADVAVAGVADQADQAGDGDLKDAYSIVGQARSRKDLEKMARMAPTTPEQKYQAAAAQAILKRGGQTAAQQIAETKKRLAAIPA